MQLNTNIDVLLTHPKYVSLTNPATQSDNDLIIFSKKSPKNLLQLIIDRLKEINFLTDVISFGEIKFMGVCILNNFTIHRRINMR